MKPYTRAVSGTWWTRLPYYRWYMLRELSSLFITLYALVLLWGLAALASGRARYEAWLDAIASPGWMLFHALAFALVCYHSWTWFRIMPKTLPRLPLPDRALAITGLLGALAASALLLWMA